MRRLIWLVIALMALYSGYWFVGARAVERGAEAALELARADGRADAAGVSLAGFPSRFDLTFEAPRLQSGDGAIAWSAPFAQVFALSYRPNEVILYAPAEQSLRIGAGEFRLLNEDMRASAALRIGGDLPLDRATAIVTAPRLAPADGGDPAQTLAARELRAAIRAVETPNAYEIGLEVLDLDLPPAVLAALGRETGLSGRIARLHLDGRMRLSTPLDRHVQWAAPPRMTAFDLAEARLDWAGLSVLAHGQVEITATGQPEGRIMLRTHDWQKMLQLALQAGLVPPERMIMFGAIAGQMAAQTDDGAVELPLSFHNGMTSLGPLPLGPAPYLQ